MADTFKVPAGFKPPYPSVGLYTTTGLRNVDLWKMAYDTKYPDYSKTFGATTAFTPDVRSAFAPSEYQTDYGKNDSSTGDISKVTKENIELYRQLQPLFLEQMQASAGLQAELSRRQMQDLYPMLSAAAAESTARNLAASQTYRRFAEGLPSNVQNIMASKQEQMKSAQAGEAALQYATADQLRAAKESQGRFAGQYVQFG